MNSIASNFNRSLLAGLLGTGLAACGGSDSGGTGSFSLSVTDAPVDADQDDPETDDDANMSFVGEMDVTLTAGETTTHNF